MKQINKVISTSLLAAIMLICFSPAAFAHTSATTYLPNSMSTWNSFGAPSVSGYRTTLEGSEREWVYIDIDAKNIDDKYVLLASYVDKNDTRSSYSTTDRNRSGNPYLYAYYLDSSGKIKKYLSGSSIVSTNRSDSDHVVYGIFPMISGTKTIRVFLKQSSVKNISNTGVNVTFTNPILIEASSQSSAQSLLDAYRLQNISLTYQNTTSSTQSSSSSSSTTSCAGTKGTNVFKIGFESSEQDDTALKFGSSLAAWVYGVHDYTSSMSPYDYVSTSQKYSGKYGLRLINSSYGYSGGNTATSPQLYDEALRYVTTAKLEKNARYAFSLRAKYDKGTSDQSSVSFYLSQETGTDGNGQISNTKLVNANRSWNCLEYQFTNRETSSTVQDLVVFFGTLPKGSKLYLDDIQLIKR